MTHGWSGEHWNARSRASSISWRFSSASRCSRSSNVPSSGWIAVCPPASDPIAHGLPGSSGPAAAVLFGPFRLVCPIGWIGGRYNTSNRSSAMSGTSAATSRSVPCRPGSGDAERGKSSYQAPWRARSRAATISSSGEVAAPRRRSGCEDIRRMEVLGQRERGPRGGVLAAHDRCGLLEPIRIVVGSRGAGAPHRTAHERRPFLELDGHVLAGGTALLEVRPPRRPGIDPALDAEAVGARLGDRHLRPPVVVPEGNHRRLDPVGIVMADQDARSRQVVPVGEHVRLDRHDVADRGLRGKEPAVDGGRHVLDHDPRQRGGLDSSLHVYRFGAETAALGGWRA